MLLCKRLSVWTIVGLLVLATTAAAQAQRGRGAPPQAKPEGKQLESPIKGVIEMVAAGGVGISCGEEKWKVMIPPDAAVRVTGPAELDFLQPGLCVQFSAMFDKKAGKVKGEVGKLTAFTPTKDLALGVFTDLGSGGAPAAKSKPGADPAPPAADAGGGDYQSQMISGQIISVRGNKLTIHVPTVKGRVQVELVESPTIDVNLDYHYARAGDNLEITKGTKYEKQCVAVPTDGKITLAQPLTGTHKKKGGGKAGHHAKKPGADEPAEKPEKPPRAKAKPAE